MGGPDGRYGARGPIGSAPAQRRRDMRQDAFQHVRIVIDAQLVWHGQQQRVGFGDRLILAQLLDQPVGLRGIGAAEHGAHIVDDANLVAVLPAAEILPVLIVHQGEDRS